MNTEVSEDRPILKEFGRKSGLSYDGRGLLFPSIHPILLPNVATRTRREHEADAIEYLANTGRIETSFSSRQTIIVSFTNLSDGDRVGGGEKKSGRI